MFHGGKEIQFPSSLQTMENLPWSHHGLKGKLTTFPVQLICPGGFVHISLC